MESQGFLEDHLPQVVLFEKSWVFTVSQGTSCFFPVCQVSIQTDIGGHPWHFCGGWGSTG